LDSVEELLEVDWVLPDQRPTAEKWTFAQPEAKCPMLGRVDLFWVGLTLG